MILALATRASLGHGGRVIRENGVTVAAYVCVIAEGIPRVFAGLDGKFGLLCSEPGDFQQPIDRDMFFKMGGEPVKRCVNNRLKGGGGVMTRPDAV